MEITVVLEPQEKKGYAVYVPSLSKCISQGESKEGAISNIKDAIELYLETDINELVECTGKQITVAV